VFFSVVRGEWPSVRDHLLGMTGDSA